MKGRLCARWRRTRRELGGVRPGPCIGEVERRGISAQSGQRVAGSGEARKVGGECKTSGLCCSYVICSEPECPPYHCDDCPWRLWTLNDPIMLYIIVISVIFSYKRKSRPPCAAPTWRHPSVGSPTPSSPRLVRPCGSQSLRFPSAWPARLIVAKLSGNSVVTVTSRLTGSSW
jgi:hypothetical protein